MEKGGGGRGGNGNNPILVSPDASGCYPVEYHLTPEERWTKSNAEDFSASGDSTKHWDHCLNQSHDQERGEYVL
jgi:hypothetical protein